MSIAYEPVIGIEVHAQLKTNTKLFCGASVNFGDAPNTNISPVCLGLPGALPVLNKQAVQLAVIAGYSLDCQVRNRSVFSRKNYFYPDLPKGYQISQFDLPICEHGSLTIDVEGAEKVIGITRIHMEEDAGKLVHQGSDAIAGATHSLVDLNRAGTALIEIVSEPDIRSALEARLYVEKLRLILQHMGICDGNMDEGSLRADANVSIRPVGTETFGTRTEVKNLNSFRSLERAILVEIERQTEVLSSGGEVIQETRNYDDATQSTTSLRSKEDAHDYRYFPEPDLPPLVLTEAYLEKVKEVMPELPSVKQDRYTQEYGLSDFECKVLMGDVDLDAFFRACLKQGIDIAPKSIAKWVVGDVSALMKDSGGIGQSKLTSQGLMGLLDLIQQGTLSGKMGKEVLAKLFKEGGDPKSIVERMGVSQITDTSALDQYVDQVLADNPDVVAKIKAGKTQSANFLMGQVMKLSKGQAKPDLVREMILKRVG